MKIKLDNKWRFFLQDFSPDALGQKDLWARDFDDSDWEKVDVPYDWAVKFPFNKKNSSGTAYLPGGTGWFRYHFDSVKDAKNAFLCFDGIYKHSRVWLNGYYLGNWQNGFTPFEMDASGALKSEGENVLAVCVDHRDIADCRWYTGSGIMRPVYLKLPGDIYFPEDGIKFESKDNEIFLCVKAKNLSSEDKAFTLKIELKDSSGNLVLQKEENLTVLADELCKFNFSQKISGVKKWSVEQPNLYSLFVSAVLNKKESDSYSTKIGFRDLEFNAEKGFFCNGKNYKLKGVCLHEDAGVLGNAVPKEVWRRRLEKLLDCGCNAIRMSHNPHCEELYELCDEMGFFVFDEIYDEWQEPKNKWWQGHNVYPPSHQGITDDFLSCYKKDIRAFVTKRWNHASVIMWSIGNEIDYPNDPYCSPKFKEMTGNNDASKPSAERQYNPNHPDISQISGIAKMLSAEVKKWDLSRPVTMALAFPELSADTGVIDALDVIGYNYKEQFYEEDHKRFAGKMFVGSENQHALEFWQAVEKNDFVAGQFLWTGIDYLGEAKGWPVHGSEAGLLDLAGFEKPMFYFRKALWSEKKFAKIFTSVNDGEDWSENWSYASGEEVLVRVYTNEDSVELFLNNNKISSKQNCSPFVDFKIKFEEGVLSAKTANSTDEISTFFAPVKFDAKIKDYGGNIKQIEIYLCDKNGKIAANSSQKVFVETEGSILLAGLENGDLSDVTEYSANYRNAKNGRLIAYAYANKDSKLIIKSKGLKTYTLNF